MNYECKEHIQIPNKTYDETRLWTTRTYERRIVGPSLVTECSKINTSFGGSPDILVCASSCYFGPSSSAVVVLCFGANGPRILRTCLLNRVC
jgi:hypothetical protein